MSVLPERIHQYLSSGSPKRALGEAALLYALILTISVGAALQAIDLLGLSVVSLAITSLLVMGSIVLIQLPRHYPFKHFGLCNAITLSRAALVCWLAGLIAAPQSLFAAPFAWAVVGVAGVTLLLDGADGWAARRSGLMSRFGARFDMEVDSLFAIVLATLVWQSGKVGAWVLLLGFIRPLFIMAGLVFPKLTGPLPDSWLRKFICVIQIAVLAVLLAPSIVAPGAVWLAATTLALLALSFTRDIVWLSRQ
ncbi:MAG: CDP-alcohol phosphatidyltransferase family protein [Orrella sp.]